MHHDLILHPTIGSPDRALNGIFLHFLYLNIQLQQIILNFCFCKWLFLLVISETGDYTGS
jgi:hypothetical protein